MRIVAFDIEEPTQELIRKAIESGYSRIPIYRGHLNNIAGILYTKKLLAALHRGGTLDLKEFLATPFFVPSAMKVSQVLRRLQGRKAHLALVVDEHGEIEGLVTLEDVLEEIVGDISDETDEADKSIYEENGKWVVAGNVSIVDFNKHFHVKLPDDEGFSTVAGFILEKLERFPKKGDVLEFDNLKFNVKDVTSRTIRTIFVESNK